MVFRRWILPITLLVGAACSDGTTPTGPAATGPASGGQHFLKWGAASAPQFEAVGTVAQGAGFLGGPMSSFASAPPVVAESRSSATANATTLSWSHTVGTGTNRFLLVGVSIRNANNTVTRVSYAGQALTYVGAQSNGDGTVRVELWSLQAPPSGTATVTMTLSGGAKMVGGAVSFTGVDPMAPLGAFTSAGSPGAINNTNPSVALTDALSNWMAVSVVATEGSAGSLTPASGQTRQYTLFYGNSGGDVAGGASTVTGSGTVTMGWTKGANAKWVIGAIALHQAPVLAPSVNTYSASFWAVKGKSRSIQINYVSGGSSAPFMLFTATDPSYVPGRGNLATGDSVLVTVSVDSTMVAVYMAPSGLQFGTPATLKIWYGGVGGDLNGDGVVNATDTYIETNLLGMWTQPTPGSAWTPIAATQSLSEKSFTTSVPHFSGYGVSW
jgi:hypothetical protein